MKKIFVISAVVFGGLLVSRGNAEIRKDNLVVPLVAIDPYINSWQWAKPLNGGIAHSWFNGQRSMMGGVRVDGVDYGFMGDPYCFDHKAEQTACRITPTTTAYDFQAGPIDLTVRFVSAHLPADLKVASLPLTFIEYEFSARDGKAHDIDVYIDIGYDWVRSDPEVEVDFAPARKSAAGYRVVSFGRMDQQILNRAGDMEEMDWGHCYLLQTDAPRSILGGAMPRMIMIADFAAGADEFNPERKFPKQTRMRHNLPEKTAVAGVQKIHLEPGGTHHGRVILAYDDQYSIEYLGQRLKAYWTTYFASTDAMLDFAWRDADRIVAMCSAFDEQLLNDASRVGGEKFADLIALSHRQVLSGGKIVASPKGEPWFLHKENSSNGCIATVDVTFPASPYFLLFNPELVKGMLVPILDYAESDGWYFDFAPHDLGHYPLANGQQYGGVQRMKEKAKPASLMPVEECGNMLLLAAMYVELSDDQAFLEQYWETLSKWANYLSETGFDPGEQLCTDDFSGHLAHNSNLSLKTISALGGYGKLCRRMGMKAEAETYRTMASEFARRWVEIAFDQDHYKLAFDRPGTWSLKYNLLWDQLLDLNNFPASVAEVETAYYLKNRNRYGTPLDNRSTITKVDWLVWAATLSGSQEDLRQLIAPVHDYLEESIHPLPFADMYKTENGAASYQDVRGYFVLYARVVLGGIYMPLVLDRQK